MLIDVSSLVRRQRSLHPQRLLRDAVEVAAGDGADGAGIGDDVDVVDPDDTWIDGEPLSFELSFDEVVRADR